MGTSVSMDEPIDVVYAWVDGSWPGYADQLAAHATAPIDRNPNRYRDNLDLLKFSLRSLERFAPWTRRVYLVTARPQVPRWLDRDTPSLRVVHHDEIFEARHLPTFSSFAIETYLHRLPGLSRRFIYVNDDMILSRPVGKDDFASPSGPARVHLEWNGSLARPTDDHPWRAAVGASNTLLDAAFGRRRFRRFVRHAPALMDESLWKDLIARWPDAIEQTRSNRFRSKGSIAPEFLYPHFCLETRNAVSVSVLSSYRAAAYIGLDNNDFFVASALAFVRWLRPAFLTLNDNFGDTPSPRVVHRVQHFLESWFPAPSKFELAGEASR